MKKLLILLLLTVTVFAIGCSADDPWEESHVIDSYASNLYFDRLYSQLQDGIINYQSSLGLHTELGMGFEFRSETIDFAEWFFGMPPMDPMLLPAPINTLGVQDFYGGEAMQFISIGKIPMSEVGFPFDFEGINFFNLNEPNPDEGVSLGSAFSASDRDGNRVLGFVIQSSFGDHRFEMGSLDQNPAYLPSLEFSATGGYDMDNDKENPAFRFRATDAGDDEWWLRAFPLHPNAQPAFEPFGFMFGTGTSNHGLHSGDVVITPTDYDGEGDMIGGNLEVQGSLYMGGGIHPVQMSDAAAPSNTLYYSTDRNKLCYKDPGGTVNELY